MSIMFGCFLCALVALVLAWALFPRGSKTTDLGEWLAGGYNLPSEEQVDRAPSFSKREIHDLPPAVSEEAIDEAPLEKRDPPPSKGLWEWMCGGYNVPHLPHVEPIRGTNLGLRDGHIVERLR